MKGRRLRSIVLVPALILLTAMTASAGPLIWGVNPSDSSPLYNLDPFSGTVATKYALPAPIASPAGDTNIGLAGWTNALYYTNADQANDTVYVLNPADGSLTASFTVSGGWQINGLGYYADASGSWIFTSGCSVGDVHRYNATNGASPQYFWSDISNPTSVAGDNGGKIFTYGQGAAGAWGIWQMNPLVDIASTWFTASPSTSVVGMAYDGTYLYLSDTAGKLFVMNNAGQLVSTLNLGYNLYALASSEGSPTPTVPEPASLLLLGTGLAGLARWRKRRS